VRLQRYIQQKRERIRNESGEIEGISELKFEGEDGPTLQQ
jgi:hypothetical protein